jgi:Polyketide cyclase / dehydrase and lipid transport
VPWGGSSNVWAEAPEGSDRDVGSSGEADAMATESEHISAWIDRSADEVYEYASDPANLPNWASGLGSSVARVDGQWVAESPMGRVAFAFVPRNDYGVLDHNVKLPSGEIVYNPMRVLAAEAGCEVVFTLRRRPGVSDEEFARDANAVRADIARLKRLTEGG